MNASELVKKYLQQRTTMQIATVDGDRPWLCTVRFLADHDNNLFWTSLPSRRHSQEIEKHPLVACTVVVQDVVGKPVIAIQIEGEASQMPTSENNRSITERYAKTYLRDAQWVDDFVTGQTEHRLYRITPSSIYLFDEENFPGGQRQKVL